MNSSVIKQEELTTPENIAAQTEAGRTPDGDAEAGRRGFVEPEISVPVDVLEATTFFQGLTSGVTLP